MNEVIKMLEKAQKEKLWGNLQIDFHNGEIVLVRKTETTKLGTESTRHEYRNSR
jgi:ribosomal protein S1